MSNYIVPQVLINQLVSEVQLNTTKNQNALVIGPNYELFRYSDPDEKQKINIGRYDGADNQVVNASGTPVPTTNIKVGARTVAAIDYPNLPSNTVPDDRYVRVYADEAYLRLVKCDADSSMYAEVEETEPGTNVFTTIWFMAKLTDDFENRDERFLRNIVPGDALYIKKTGDNMVFKTRIVSVSDDGKPGRDAGGTYVTVADSLRDLADAGDIVPASYDASNDTWTPAKFNIDTTNGFNINFCAVVDSLEIESKTHTDGLYNWQAVKGVDDTTLLDAYGIKLPDNASPLKADYSNWYPAGSVQYGTQFDVLSADLYVQYRALRLDSTGNISSVESAALVESLLGAVVPDNPLAFGVYMAALNSGDRVVYYLGVPSDDLSGYNTALGKATLTSDAYVICPTTRDKTVVQAVKSHVNEMSTSENKLWRIGVVSMDIPTEDMVYDKSANPSGQDFVAAFSSVASLDPQNSAETPEFRVMTFWEGVSAGEDPSDNGRPSTVTRCLAQVEAGDKVRVYTGNSKDTWDDTPGYTVYTVAKVLDNASVLLTEPLDIDSSDDDYRHTSVNAGDADDDSYLDQVLKVELYRVLDAAQQVEQIARQSSQLATRRMYNVFPGVASNAGTVFTGEFLACAVGGLVSSVLPQQPLTNIEINGVDDVPVTYQTYTRTQLNTIAAGGTFIVMQDLPGSKVYVRHQISTDYTSNNLLKAELSVTKNLDSISYYFAEVFAPYIGKYNITPELIMVLESKLSSGLSSLEADTGAGLYGPQIIADGTEILYVRQDAVNKDHVKARVRLNLPVPFNYFDLDLVI